MKKVLITVLTTLLALAFVSTTFAQTDQVTYYNGESIPLFQGTLAYQDGFSHDTLASQIISSNEAFYSAQYYGARDDSPSSIKLAVLDGYVVWQFDFADQIICVDAQDATNAYALPVDGIAYTYIIDDFANDNVVYSDTASYVDSASSSVAVYDTAVQAPVQTSSVQATASQQNYNISSGGYSDLYNGYATYEEYLTAYMAMTNTMSAEHNAAAQVLAQAAVPTTSNYAEIVYLGNSNSPSQAPSTISVQPTPATAAVGPVQNLGIIGVANTASSQGVYNAQGYDSNGYDLEGYNYEGYNRAGYDREGYNREGYNQVGYDRDGYNQAGYNPQGYDREGFNAEGYNVYGYNHLGERR